MRRTRLLSLGCMSKAALWGTAALLAVCCLPIVRLNAQAPAPPDPRVEPLQMIVNYPDGAQKRRESAGETVEPVAMRPGQQVTITLRFLRKRAGDEVRISPLDGGEVDISEPVTVSTEGDVTFTFRAGTSPGMYRLAVMGVFQYELSFHVVPAHRIPTPWSRNRTRPESFLAEQEISIGFAPPRRFACVREPGSGRSGERQPYR